MTTNHTPGPWIVGTQSPIDGIILADGICSVIHKANDHVSYTVAELVGGADARLIASAPDLLAALAHIAALETADEFDERTNGEGMSGDDAVEALSGVIRIARAAIARAKGEA